MLDKNKSLGFLLSRQWRDTVDGINLSFWLTTPEGPVHAIIEKQQAVCFIRSKNNLSNGYIKGIKRKTLELNTLDHESVDALYFNQQRQLNSLREHLAYDKTQLLESEIKPTERYLMERFITASVNIHGTPLQRAGYIEYKNPKLTPASYIPEFKCVSLDIETEDLRGKLYSIAVVMIDTSTSYPKPDGDSTADNRIEHVFMIQQAPLAYKEGYNDSNITWCGNEKEALQAFFNWMRIHDPDVIIGWNVIAFDLEFLQWKCKQLCIPFAIGRGNRKEQNSTILIPQQTGQMHLARIPGRVVLDGISSLRGAFWSFDSFALDFVSEQLLGKKKLINKSGKEKLAEIRRQYKEDPVALAEYNLEDCRLVLDIFDKTDLLNFSIQRAQMTGLAIDRQGGSSAAFDNLYLPRLHRQGFVAPDVGSQQNKQESPGGYVMDSQPGLYDNVLVLDFKSLYPSIIRTFKIDPLGLSLGLFKEQSTLQASVQDTEQLKEEVHEKTSATTPSTESIQILGNTIPGFLGAEFSRDQHILPDVVTELWKQRDEAKKHNNKPLSQAIKIIMNSFYGVLGSSGCRFFNPQLASSITMRGHEIIQMSRNLIEEKGYNVIYGDTDSVFVLLGENKNEEECEEIGKELQKSLNIWWEKYLKDEFAIESNLEIEFETHYLRFLMPTIRGAETGSKKRYAGMINKDGEKKMVFKGLETVRTDWTPLAREFQQELYQRIFNNLSYKDFIKETHDALIEGRLDEKLTYTKRLRRPLESYVSMQPPQVKAARKMKNPGRKIQYVITLNGPEPIENLLSTPNYQHYVDKQLAPVADSILYFLGMSFAKITDRQLDVFD